MTRSLHYNGNKTFLFANATKIYQFKVKNSEIKPYPLCRKYFKTFYSQQHEKKKKKKNSIKWICLRFFC